jgi:histidinol phosphatase-like enzyme
MKTFDWDYAKSVHSKAYYSLISDLHDKEVTEEQYVCFFLAERDNFKRKPDDKTPSKARGEYRNLKKKFGFFIGDNATNKQSGSTSLL